MKAPLLRRDGAPAMERGAQKAGLSTTGRTAHWNDNMTG
jgi:hypothetical protein